MAKKNKSSFKDHEKIRKARENFIEVIDEMEKKAIDNGKNLSTFNPFFYARKEVNTAYSDLVKELEKQYIDNN